MPSDLKPSDVYIGHPVPLVDTFGRCENEFAAALLLLTMRRGDDTFRAVAPKEVGEAIQAEKDRFRWLSNPLLRPDIDALIEAGYAEWTDPDAGRGSPVAFTDAGIEQLRTSRWVRRG